MDTWCVKRMRNEFNGTSSIRRDPVPLGSLFQFKLMVGFEPSLCKGLVVNYSVKIRAVSYHSGSAGERA